MRILFIGDIVGSQGRHMVQEHLGRLVDEKKIDFVIANGENATGGFGLNQRSFRELADCGIDAFTTGNHTWDNKDIYNYIDKQKVIEKAEEKTEVEFNENDINFVTVTRLVEQKGIDRLIEVHKKLIDNKLYHKFYVIGDGPEREKLENMIKKEGIGETFILLGKLDNPYPYIKNANYFCLLSKFEGYGMVIEEAKILNKPVIITDTAAREAVKEYENSMILENSEKGIYEGIKSIIEKGFKEKEITIKYNNEGILGQVEKII